jgi:hypothetical protein
MNRNSAVEQNQAPQFTPADKTDSFGPADEEPPQTMLAERTLPKSNTHPARASNRTFLPANNRWPNHQIRLSLRMFLRMSPLSLRTVEPIHRFPDSRFSPAEYRFGCLVQQLCHLSLFASSKLTQHEIGWVPALGR